MHGDLWKPGIVPSTLTAFLSLDIKRADAMSDETILYEAHPAMFKSNPLLFILCAVTIIPLVIWYLKSRGTTLIVTDDQTTLRTGIPVAQTPTTSFTRTCATSRSGSRSFSV